MVVKFFNKYKYYIIAAAAVALAVVAVLAVNIGHSNQVAAESKRQAHALVLRQAQEKVEAEERARAARIERAHERAHQKQAVEKAQKEAEEAKRKSEEPRYVPVPVVPTGPACSDNPNVPLPSCTAPYAGGPSWTQARHEAYLNKLEAAGTSSSVAECVTNGIEANYSETEVEALHPTSSLSEQPETVQNIDRGCEYE